MSKPFLNSIVFSFLLFLIHDQSCAQQGGILVEQKAGVLTSEMLARLKPEVDFSELTKNYREWWSYTYYNIRFQREFIGLDTDAIVLEKKEFLKKMSTGKFISIKLQVPGNHLVYRLFPAEQLENSTRDSAARMAQQSLIFYEMEGKLFPQFDVVDVKGQTYNQTSLLGKLTVMKTWFIKCLACIQEFPEVNKLVDHYQTNPKVQFLSLATDPEAKLTAFLKENELKYSVIPSMGKFISDALKLNAFPTHLVIGTDGKILKVFDHLDDMKFFIASEIKKLEYNPISASP